ncbi:hypothetical protein PHYBLDRAFT_166626 [Phycomyces blakesleeanus NRRL 1555(-)]|uniref:Uncharacterized protein n=1 Tax=Phycomyces blakesleeanus (strain ATCC 8743b / DSM 1359 / FGSC 10004 / NBRC 33097 / NRRL 1555) TaxID=763407 RepID=A0A167N929_PHYB8|nr:hypothetical protein PHYBLDRAFT_166626 [Phycomyces blakesleeanus NRRL 1555(-)]OAD75379.1 hypothetical protein PHYBLDRAFT_166626 [Phycomyces blakesleeanus NRRL 1555(-)]|eukprot:XP_018293419.1 hypothetical protein PHYBLDRAFT_166626 [Phycomyces blakesleeanus NRRL 1555(-)]
MFSITKRSSYKCRFCNTFYNSTRKVNLCRIQYMKTCSSNMVNFEISQPISVSEQTNIVSSIVSGYTSDKENTATIDNQTVDAFNNGDNDNDQPMYDADLDHAMDDIHVKTSPLIFDFSQPTPISNNDDAKNLKFIKIIKDFGILREAHEMIARHFNKILETSNDITYRACSSYLGDKLLERFSSVKGDKYDICHNDCKLYNDSHETVCLNCGEAHYKNDAKDKDGLTLPGTTICIIESFRSFNPDSVLYKGLKGQSPFASLTSFTGPFFFALNEMHGLSHGIGKQVWGLVCRKYGSKHPLFLSAGAQKKIDVAIEGTRESIPTSFHGAWREVARHAEYFRAVNWANFLLFVVPTLVAERIHNQDAQKALLGLVQACTLLMSWDVIQSFVFGTYSDLSLRNLIKWNSYLEGHFQNGKVGIEIFTINQHLLQHYPAMINAFGPPRAYSARSLERAIGEYSRSIKSNSAIGANAGNIMLRLACTRCVDVNGALVVKARATARILQYNDESAGWPMTEEGERVDVDSDIEFWGPLEYKTIHDSIEEISCLPVLLAKFHESKGVECSTIDSALTTSRKAFVNGCVIDSVFAHKVQREAHHIHLQLQINKATNARSGSSPALKHFFGKVVLFFEHVNEGKRWPLTLVLVYSTMLYNGVPVARNGQMKPKVVHLVDVKELVGLVVSDATVNTITAMTTAYIVWPELNRGPKLSLGSFADI